MYQYIKTLQFSVFLHLLLNSKTQGCPYKFLLLGGKFIGV